LIDKHGVHSEPARAKIGGSFRLSAASCTTAERRDPSRPSDFEGMDDQLRGLGVEWRIFPPILSGIE